MSNFKTARLKRASSDPRASSALIHAALAAPNDETYYTHVGTLQARGNAEELALSITLSQSTNPKERHLAANILGQLGWGETPFMQPSVTALIDLLSDSDDGVVASAAIGLGHRGDPSAVPHLVKLSTHPNPEVRRGVTHGLLAQEAPNAIRTMIALSKDADAYTRDWATFGLAQQIEADTPPIRNALLARLNAKETDPNVRAEALSGLVARGDSRAVQLTRAELARGIFSPLLFEAAEQLADPALYPALRSAYNRQIAYKDASAYDIDQLQKALDACKPSTP